MMPALHINMSRRSEVNWSNAALTESREVRSALRKEISTSGAVAFTLAAILSPRISSRPVK